MKFNKYLALFSSLMLLVSCGSEISSSEVSSSFSSELKDSSIVESSSEASSSETSSSSEVISSTSSESSSEEIVDDKPADKVSLDGFKWKFNEDDCFSDSIDFSLSANDPDAYLEVYLDDEIEISPKQDSAMTYQFMYEFGESETCVDGVEHCYDTVKVNNSNKYVQYLHNDLSKKVTFTADNFRDGENYITINTGYVYRTVEYSFNNVNLAPGNADDFEIKNIYLLAGDGTKIYPNKVCKHYLNSSLTKEVTVIEEVTDLNATYQIGDGWEGCLSYLGNPTEKWNRPINIDFFFDIEKPVNSANYSIDSNKYKDGNHYLSCYCYNDTYDGEVVLQNNIKFDNLAPEIKVNANDYATISKGEIFDIEISDSISSVKSYSVKVDGKNVDSLSVDTSSLTDGNHNLLVEAIDIGGNVGNLSVQFKIASTYQNTFNVSMDKTDNKVNVNIDSSLSSSNKYNLYEANKLNVLTLNEGDYKYFEVETSKKDEKLYLNFDASTYEYEKILLEAYNPTTLNYEKIGTYYSGKINLIIDINNYYNSGKVKFRMSQYKEGNGSDTFLWVSDTQYLAKVEERFDDIRGYYTTLMKYIKNEYLNGNICYMSHTGDAVDDNPKLADAASEWQVASNAFKIIDEASVPYGMCAGNHDVGSQVTDLNYSLYANSFGLARFIDADYKMGAINDNYASFDLVTIGGYDFIFVYIGYGIEAFDETIEWVNKVLKQYSYRNAIIATHAYLDNDGTMDSNARGQEIYDKVVVPNENVLCVLCGHTDGSQVIEKQIGSRKVYELLSCYQFVETLTDGMALDSTKHVTSGLKCNGEGFIKSMVVKDGKIKAHTYSPVINVDSFSTTNGIDYKTNDYTISVDLLSPLENLIEVNYFEVLEIGKEIKSIGSSKKIYSFDIDDPNKTYLCYVLNAFKGYGFAYC